MTLFGFLKKKPKAADIELPPPPKPPEMKFDMPEEEEIPAIRPGMPEPKLPELPEEESWREPPEMPLPMYEEEVPEPIQTRPDFPPSMEVVDTEPEETPTKVFDKTIKEFMPQREDIISPQDIKPMFVAVDEYKNLAGNTQVIRAKLLEAEDYLSKLSDLKNQKAKVFKRWRKMLEDTEKKLSYVDAVIEKAQG